MGITLRWSVARTFLTERKWARLEPLLPSEQGGMGRPRLDNRPTVEAIPWKHRTGAPWRDLPESFGPWNTVFTRFNRWKPRDPLRQNHAQLQRHGRHRLCPYLA